MLHICLNPLCLCCRVYHLHVLVTFPSRIQIYDEQASTNVFTTSSSCPVPDSVFEHTKNLLVSAFRFLFFVLHFEIVLDVCATLRSKVRARRSPVDGSLHNERLACSISWTITQNLSSETVGDGGLWWKNIRSRLVRRIFSGPCGWRFWKA